MAPSDARSSATGPVSFAGRVAVVTGGGRGLGRAYALDLARRGAAVVLNSAGESATEVAEEIVARGGTAVADRRAFPEDAAAVVRAAVEMFGRVDALVNNAGTVVNAAFGETPLEAFDAQMDIHVRGTFVATQEAYRHMRRQGYGRIVFTSSASGLLGLPGQSAYGAAKAALVGLCNVVALEGAEYGVLANAVAPMALTNPGRTEAAAHLQALLGERSAAMTAEFVVPLVVYLASDSCTSTHGVYSAVAGRYARFFTGVTRGWASPRDRVPTAEEVAAHLAAIEDETGYAVPRSLLEEVRLVGDSDRSVSP